MVQEPTFNPTKFPIVTKVGTPYEHPITGQIYVYGGTEKRSWRLVSDIENRIYTGANAPSQDTENLKHGDLWWDSEYMELRVYHKLPLGTDSEGTVTYSEGVWISSTHPMMDPDEPGKMKQFGDIIFTPPTRVFVEGSEFKFVAHLPYATAPMNEWEVSAVVTPPYFGADPDNPITQNKVFVDFDNDITTNPKGEINGSLVLGVFPLGTSASERTVRVTLTVKALEGQPDEFYDTYYQTISYGSFTGAIEPLPDLPPLVVNTLPFNERMDDTLRQHAGGLDLSGEEYTDKVSKTIRFEQTNPTTDSGLVLKSRIDGADFYDGVRYPDIEQCPIVALDAKTGNAKELIILFKYGQAEGEQIATFYTDKDDEFGVIRNSEQNEFIQLGNVNELITNYRIAFYTDGEDDQTVSQNPNLWTNRFTDMGIVTEFVSEGPGGSNIVNRGVFIGLRLDGTNTKLLPERDGRRRLYFALINEGIPQLGTAADIVASSKGYIDIEPFKTA